MSKNHKKSLSRGLNRGGARFIAGGALVSFACSSPAETSDIVAAPQALSAPAALGAPSAPTALRAPGVPPAPAVGPQTPSPTAAGVVPGELIVKYRSSGAHAVTKCAERWTHEGRSFRGATADQSASLDALHQGLAVRRARAVMPGRRGLTTQDAQNRLTARARRKGSRALRGKGRSFADLVNLYVLEVPAQSDVMQAARTLAADPHVEYAQPNYRITTYAVPNDPYFASTGSWGQLYDDLWGMKRIAAPAAWDAGQGAGVVVAVVDTGLDLTHPDIAANVWQNPGEIGGNGVDDDQNGYIDDVNGWNFADGVADPTDDVGHGTHVSGTIAAVGDNGIGVVGVAPRAKIQAVKALGVNGGSTDSLALGLAYAVENGADVINNSWGCTWYCPRNPVIEEMVELAHDAGVTMVFSAGNTASDIGFYSPQNQPNVIVVSASDPADGRVPFSNHGFVDVAAPGGGFFAAPPDDEPVRAILSLKSAICTLCPPHLVVGEHYLRQAGTSMAAPHVAGAAAVILGQHPDYSPEQVRQALRAGSADTGAPGVDLDSGYGRLDVAASLAEATPLEALITAPLGQLSGTSAEIMGTVGGPGFASYVLEVGVGAMPATFTTLASSTSPVTAGSLGTWGLAEVPEGVNTLRVRALTTDGRTYEDRQAVTMDRVVITEPSWDPTDTVATLDAYGQSVTIRGTVVPFGFVSYELGVRTLDGVELPDAVITLSGGGAAPVVDGVLGIWDTAGVPAGGYEIVVTVHVTEGEPITDVSRALVDRSFHPGWPLDFSPPIWMRQLLVTDHLTLADVNRDGAAEVLVGHGTEVAVLDHTGSSLPGWPQTIDPAGIGAQIEKSPAVADVTGDGVPEVIGANDAGSVFVWSADGQLVHATRITEAPCVVLALCTPSVAVDDVNRDGVKDVIVTHSSGVVAVLRGSDGAMLLRQSLGARELSAPALGDVNGDGALDIAVIATDPPGTSSRAVDVFVLGLGSVLPGWPQRIDEGISWTNEAHPSLGDLDGDGQLEVVVSSSTGNVTAFSGSGAPLPGWPRSTGVSAAHSPTLGDLNGDGTLEVLVGTATHWPDGTSELYALGWDGETLPGWPTTVSGPRGLHFGYGAAALADLDGDGGVDAIAASDSVAYSPFRSLNAFHADASPLDGFGKPTVYTGTSASSTAAVADVDGDGLLELAWMDFSGKLYLWDLTTPTDARRPWPMFGHDPQHTARAGEAPATQCRDAATVAGSSCRATVNPEAIDAGSFDADGDPLSCALLPAGPFAVGTSAVTLVCADDQGLTNACSARVHVGVGNDRACCPAGTRVIVGNSNNNVLTGTSGADCIIGLGGQDTINGNGGDDFISGGEGNDVISCGAGADLCFGGPGQDRVSGNAGDDVLDGGEGADQCLGGDGADTVFGGPGQDRLIGDAGADRLFGNADDDRLEGGPGSDLLDGGGLHDVCIGGADEDAFLVCETQVQ